MLLNSQFKKTKTKPCNSAKKVQNREQNKNGHSFSEVYIY